MIRQVIDSVVGWLKRVVMQPRGELDRWQRAAQFTYDLGRFGARQLKHDRAQQMAAALAFRTLFGLLPVLVAGTVLVKAMGMQDSFLEPLGRLFEFWGLDEVQIMLPTNGAAPSMTLADWLDARVLEAEQMNWAAIGWVGVGVTLYAAISLMVTIENSFNIICRARQGRRWTVRIPLYWFALTLSPVAIMCSAYVSGYFERWMDAFEGHAWLATSLDVSWSLLSIWAIMLFVYLLLPNTRVNVRPAMLGALVAAILLEVGKRTMGVYLSKALSVSQLYGSLGLVPLFMFWVYLMWLAVLFGLQVSSTLQHLRGRRLAELEQQQTESAFVESSIVLVLMHHVAARFHVGLATDIDSLTASVGISPLVIERIVERLVEAGVLHRVGESASQVSLACPSDQISVDRVLDVAFQLARDGDTEEDERLAQMLEGLRVAQRQTVAGTSLQQLLSDSAR